jgi:hypothetical protein
MRQSHFKSEAGATARRGLDIETFLARVEAAPANQGKPDRPAWPWALAGLAAGAILTLGAIFGAACGAALGEALGSALGACLK